jgi:hypothetical protein
LEWRNLWYTLYIQITIDLYGGIQDDTESIEKDLLEKLKPLTRAYVNEYIEGILSWIPLLTSPCLHYPHFFDAGEEGGGLEAEEFGGPTCAIDFPVGGL